MDTFMSLSERSWVETVNELFLVYTSWVVVVVGPSSSLDLSYLYEGETRYEKEVGRRFSSYSLLPLQHQPQSLHLQIHRGRSKLSRRKDPGGSRVDEDCFGEKRRITSLTLVSGPFLCMTKTKQSC